MKDLSDRISELSPEKRAILQRMLLNKTKSDDSDSHFIPKRSKQTFVPLSFAQERLLFLAQLEPDNSAYNVSNILRLSGSLRVSLLEKSLNEIIRRHEILRTIFVRKGEDFGQVVAPNLALVLPVTDLQGVTEAEKFAEMNRLADEQAQPIFDLEKGPLLRAALLRFSEKESVLLLTVHHILWDGWSIGIFAKELATFYKALSEGDAPSLPELPIQYSDFAVWQRMWFSAERKEAQLRFWKKQLEGAPPLLEIPSDRSRLAQKSYQSGVERFEMGYNLTQQLRHLSKQSGTSLFITLLAAFSILLYRYSHQEDIVIGSPIANRNQKEVEPLIGFFVNTLVLRTDLSGNPPFAELLERVRQTTLAGYANQDMPFEQLVEALQPERNLNHTPLFQVMFVFQNTPLVEVDTADLSVRLIKGEILSADFDLLLSMTEMESGLAGILGYNADLFDGDTIRRMIGHFQTLLKGILTHPDQKISALPLLTQAESDQLLLELNDTRASYSDAATISWLFEDQVRATPDNVAVVFEDRAIPYQKLNEDANRLAWHLRETLGIKPDELVAVILGRTERVITTFLAILKAGGAYVPIDPAYPKDRIRYILEDSGVRVILTESEYEAFTREQLPDEYWEDRHIVNIEMVEGGKLSDLPGVCMPDHAAYVIYTSGSTGLPKGCVITHRNVARLMKNDKFHFDFGPEDVWVVAHSFCFDFSVWEMYGALLYGGKVVIAKQEDVRDPRTFLELIRQHRVSVLNQTPAAFYNLLEAELSETQHELDAHLRYVIFGGDKLNPGYLSDWVEQYPLKKIALVNMYGITETTVHVTYGPLRDEDVFENQGQSPVGIPLPETQVYVCDGEMNLQPVGVPGELYVGGTGVSRGYLNREELTAERFVENPFTPGEKLYRTGDVGRWLNDGTLEFFGRNDDQVQVRGFRVELGEIESCLASHKSVEKAVIISRDSDDGVKELIAYFTRSDGAGKDLNVNVLGDHLRQTLPDYMVPLHFVPMDTFPLTSNNKVDRRNLPAPEGIRPELETEYMMPETEAEQRISEIWKETLRLEQVGIHDNFFDVGGHSLLMVRMRNKLRDAFEQDIPIVELFKYPTIHALAEYLSQDQDASDASEKGQERAEHRETRKGSVAQRRKSRLKHRKGN